MDGMVGKLKQRKEEGRRCGGAKLEIESKGRCPPVPHALSPSLPPD